MIRYAFLVCLGPILNKVRPIEKGQVWELHVKGPRNPFTKRSQVEVLAVKQGWVNYRHKRRTHIMQNESLKVFDFRFCYDLVKEI